MDPALTSLLAASIAFVGSHVALSHPLRAPLAARLGEKGFLGLYSLVSLAAFAWLLTLHEAASGRVYAAYGGMYISVAILWLWTVDGIRPSAWDVAGVVVTLAGMSIIAFQPK